MNKKETKKAIEVMQAWLDGKEIECLDIAKVFNEGDWYLLDEPAWNWHKCFFRIKPKEPREGWCHKDSFEECPISPDMTSEDWIKVREVIDEGR